MAQKNLLKYILLGLITEKPKTGYDLKKEFDTEIGEFWSVKHSQIYLELKRLEKEGEITSDTGFFGNKVEKTYYAITTLGKKHLDEWKYSYDTALAVNKDEFVLKLYFIKDRHDERLPSLLKEQLDMRQEKLSHLEGRKTLLFSTPQDIEKQYGHYLILDHAIRRESEYVTWLKEAIDSLKGNEK